MKCSNLQQLHHQFQNILNDPPLFGSQKKYLGKDASSNLVVGQKKIPLNEVFALATQSIMQEWNQPIGQDRIEAKIQELELIKQGIEKLYHTRYCHWSKKWKRIAVKILIFFTPLIFKSHFSSLAKNIKSIEEKTKTSYETCQEIINKQIKFIEHTHSTYPSQPNLKTIMLNNKAKESLQAEECTSLLEAHPLPKLMKQCYKLCQDAMKIQLPMALIAESYLDLRGYKDDQLESIFKQMSQMTQLKLSSTSLSDQEIARWIDLGLFRHLKSLDIKDCSQLTTDVVIPLLSLPNLKDVELAEDLKKGKTNVADFPVIYNPFKVAQVYVKVNHLRKLALSHYKGPFSQAHYFQIPLMRIDPQAFQFPLEQKKLDPESVAKWLSNNDFQDLTLQPAIQDISAEHCHLIYNDNLVAFIQKFPNIKRLSLAHCPNITDKGLENLSSYLQMEGMALDVLDLTEFKYQIPQDLNQRPRYLLKKRAGE